MLGNACWIDAFHHRARGVPIPRTHGGVLGGLFLASAVASAIQRLDNGLHVWSLLLRRS